MLPIQSFESSTDDYAYLPDELLEKILDGTDEISEDVKSVYKNLVENREKLRGSLIQQGKVARVADLEPVPSPSVAAVDGGMAVEKSIGADTVLVAAVGVEGLVREDQRKWTGVQYSHWQKVLPHSGEAASRFARGVMSALELEIAVQAPHDVIIFDGSHLTPIIGLNSMLSQNEPDLTPFCAKILSDHKAANNLSEFFQRTNLVAMVKYDSSNELSASWLADEKVKLDDRTLTTMLLDPGEYTIPSLMALTPERKQQIGDLHIIVADKKFPNRQSLNQDFETGLSFAKQIHVIYYRPWEWAPSYRIEIKRAAANSANRIATILQAVKEQVVSPEVREPYPQYLADQMAKSVGAGLQALRSAVMFSLADSGADNMLRMLAQSYRTE